MVSVSNPVFIGLHNLMSFSLFNSMQGFQYLTEQRPNSLSWHLYNSRFLVVSKRNCFTLMTLIRKGRLWAMPGQWARAGSTSSRSREPGCSHWPLLLPQAQPLLLATAAAAAAHRGRLTAHVTIISSPHHCSLCQMLEIQCPKWEHLFDQSRFTFLGEGRAGSFPPFCFYIGMEITCLP